MRNRIKTLGTKPSRYVISLVISHCPSLSVSDTKKELCGVIYIYYGWLLYLSRDKVTFYRCHFLTLPTKETTYIQYFSTAKQCQYKNAVYSIKCVQSLKHCNSLCENNSFLLITILWEISTSFTIVVMLFCLTCISQCYCFNLLKNVSKVKLKISRWRKGIKWDFTICWLV